ncbi:tryptophan 2,3-dioxygenase family protein [Aliikangiella sp. G2MR2-5]|uniref:tryptophan 2,3-dioxygenase family protein n=1 Tax=Aliikangiella sp. G2MR2-5 TaxID=2788943 RepID=UPI0018AAB47C|nr:tryptophan 2,3-dioxygenase family protein [Aliikangiella sp. G2MR2-5]
MQKNQEPCYYGEYLQLDKFLDTQQPVSGNYQEKEAHDEMLFIIVHQAYELWFKQILHELRWIHRTFNQPLLNSHKYGRIVQRLDRVIQIQRLLNQQINILETMTPLDFLDFRDYLVPASGFQSIQFKEIEILLGLKMKYRINFDIKSFYNRLNEKDRAHLMQMEAEPSLFDQVEAWLERMPFLEKDSFSFVNAYQDAVSKMLESDLEIIESVDYLSDSDREFQRKDLNKTKEQFEALFDEKKFNQLKQDGHVRMSQKAVLGAVFINLYRDEPAFQQPFQLLAKLVDVDEEFTQWRYRHTIMVHRMLGSKIGTGGSSGHDYLRQTTQNNRFFKDLFNLSTFLIPRSSLPELPKDMVKSMGLRSE